MRRRPPQPGTPLNQKQDELAQRESQLRGEMEKLERMIAEAPRVAEETTRRQREELLERASEGRSRLDVSVALGTNAGETTAAPAAAADRCERNGAKAESFFSCW